MTRFGPSWKFNKPGMPKEASTAGLLPFHVTAAKTVDENPECRRRRSSHGAVSESKTYPNSRGTLPAPSIQVK